MNTVKISTDSTSDLTKELLAKHDISVMPLYVSLGEDSYLDGIDINPEMIYDYYDKTRKVAATAAVNIFDYKTFFEKQTEDGRELVHFTISAKMSACYQNAVIAAKETDGVHIIDSQNLSTGIGLLVLKAAQLAKDGLDAKSIAEKINTARSFVNASFVIDTLEYLHKGGRCSSVAALGANLLNLKPCIEVTNGEMVVGKKYRGKIERCILQYVEDRLADTDNIDTKRIFITASKTPDDVREQVTKKITELISFEEMITTTAGSTITSHCGPGTLGVLFMRKENPRP